MKNYSYPVIHAKNSKFKKNSKSKWIMIHQNGNLKIPKVQVLWYYFSLASLDIRMGSGLLYPGRNNTRGILCSIWPKSGRTFEPCSRQRPNTPSASSASSCRCRCCEREYLTIIGGFVVAMADAADWWAVSSLRRFIPVITRPAVPSHELEFVRNGISFLLTSAFDSMRDLVVGLHVSVCVSVCVSLFVCLSVCVGRCAGNYFS